MWGIYPALVPDAIGKVVGVVWEVRSEAHFLKLAAYETAAYTWCECVAELQTGEKLSNCGAFCWADNPTSKELEEGSFDLKWYQNYFKQSVVRRRKQTQ
jgi:hypothetical protein